MTWWIPLIFLAGFSVSLIGLAASVAELSGRGLTAGLFVFGGFALFFGWVLVLWLFAPLLIRPRVVPYFARQLGEYGTSTARAFVRGRGLYREMAALDELAGTLGITPLSTFGFAYDHFDQSVQWHRASAGLATINALQSGLDARLRAAPDVVTDLEALGSVVRAAADQGVDFSLVVRLHAKDSIQAVFTRETRQGSFW